MKNEVKGLVLSLGIFIILIIGMNSVMVSAVNNGITYEQQISIKWDGGKYLAVQARNDNYYVVADKDGIEPAGKGNFQLISSLSNTGQVKSKDPVTIKTIYGGGNVLEADTPWPNFLDGNDWIVARDADYTSKLYIKKEGASDGDVITCGDAVYFVARDNEGYFWDVQTNEGNKIAADGSKNLFYIYNAEGEASCTCVPQCTGAVCGGADGCGGLCQGTCTTGECVNGACVEACAPGSGCAETGRICGPDDCGNVDGCGICTTGECNEEGQCACIPSCAGKGCGESDGCEGICLTGTCTQPEQICSEGVCVDPVGCTTDGDCIVGEEFCGLRSKICLPNTVTCDIEQKIGDIDNNRVIDNLDLDFIVGVTIGQVTEPSNICCLDLDSDESIDAIDISRLSDMISDPSVDYGNCTASICNKNGTCDDEAGETPENCPEDCLCIPQCEGKDCGSDGCDGTCGVLDGECEDGICSEGICVDSLVGETFCEFESPPQQINISERINELKIICYNETETNAEFVDCPNITNPEYLPSPASSLSLLDFKYSQRKNSTGNYGGKYYLTYNITGKVYGMAWIYTNLTDSSLQGPLTYNCIGNFFVACINDSDCLEGKICKKGSCTKPDVGPVENKILSCSNLSRTDCTNHSKWTKDILQSIESFYPNANVPAGFCTDKPYSETIDGHPNCKQTLNCSCVWDASKNKCVGSVDPILINLTADGCNDPTTGQPAITGRCQQSAPEYSGDCAIDNIQTVITKSKWVPSNAIPPVDSPSYSFYSTCTADPVTREIPCPPEAGENLPFFGMFNLIIAGIAIAIGYFMIRRRE